ncbi:hypothetical protein OG897_19475 [Streptomyces sp. NBC_00237]|uniref:hypothetical protein n=1 Tax=Streptomyces sp. NBC_00237 TaxID=2975687 RepID=UPI00224ED21C|nr:hypothetical protein [Streptomyces sp. NBC_00237]MCX5203623.1 hypothetical protein [Streptomyces sp. NBC_00237]
MRLAALHATVEDRLTLPFGTTALGATAAAVAVRDRPDSDIVALCRHGRPRPAIGIFDPPPPEPAPEGAWVEAYRHWTP